MLKKTFDLTLYLVTDRSLSNNRSMEWIVQEAVQGGVTMVQLREKDCSTREFIDLAKRLKALLKPLGVPLIINDRLDVVLAADADGLHIGQSDMDWQTARRLMGDEKILGLSIENLQQAKEADAFDIDYIGISPVFSTPTKTDTAAPLGLEGVREVSQLCRHRSVAIGGINQTNARSILEAGAEGVAVVSAIMSADSPQKSAQELLSLLKNR